MGIGGMKEIRGETGIKKREKCLFLGNKVLYALEKINLKGLCVWGGDTEMHNIYPCLI